MMNFFRTTLGVLTLASLSCAADLTGIWSGTVGGPIFVSFKQEGSSLSGTGGPSRTDQVLSFKEGKVDGDHVTFKVGPFAFDLTAEGDTLKGTFKNGEETHPAFFKRVVTRKPEDPLPTFEAATVKHSPPPPASGGLSSSMNMSPGRITGTNVSLRKLIVNSYGVKDSEVIAPDWMANELYEVIATFPKDTSGDDVLLMMQALLAERFQLKAHREPRELSTYTVSIAKGGIRMKEVEFGGGSRTNFDGAKLVATSVAMRNLTEFLARQLNRPVIDQTGLKGFYNFELQYQPEPKNAGPDSNVEIGASLFTALQEQLGLKLDSKKQTIPMLVVDHAEKIPSGN